MKRINYTSEDLKDHDGISAIIKDEKGRILMQEHVKYGFWTIPVGKAKLGQSVVEALKEETFEETNLNAIDCRELLIKVFNYVRDGIPVKVTAHLFEVTNYSGELHNNEPHKHKQQIFMSLDEIMKLPYISNMTNLYLKSIGYDRGDKL